MKHTLLIPLVGPMQAWGSRSRFDDRDTHQEPTKSGVLGLVCAAGGRDRAQSLDELTALEFGVRVDAPGRAMTDYQTAQNVARAGGGGTTTVTSQRHYLADARFLAALSGENVELLSIMEGWLRSPIWPLSLGRRAFALSLPPYFPDGSLRRETDLETALLNEPWRPLHRFEREPQQLRVVIEDAHGEASIADQPLNYATRRFQLRRIRTHICSGDGLPPREAQPLVL